MCSVSAKSLPVCRTSVIVAARGIYDIQVCRDILETGSPAGALRHKGKRVSDDLTVRNDAAAEPTASGRVTEPPQRAADRLAYQLALSVIEARLPEGTMLPPEHVLLSRLGCSRVALRGALRLLVSWGLITMRMGRDGGPMVRRPRGLELRDGLAALMHSEQATFADVMLARRAIDPIVAAEAARHATDDHVAQLDETIAELEVLVTRPAEFQQGITDFQWILAEAASLVILGVFIRALMAVSDLSLMGRLPLGEDRCRQAIVAHRVVVETVRAHDPDAAEEAMRACRVDAERYWRSHAPELAGAPLRPLAACVTDPIDLSWLAPNAGRPIS